MTPAGRRSAGFGRRTGSRSALSISPGSVMASAPTWFSDSRMVAGAPVESTNPSEMASPSAATSQVVRAWVIDFASASSGQVYVISVKIYRDRGRRPVRFLDRPVRRRL